MTTTTTTQAPTNGKLETQTCGRCAGSGRFSYCAQYGNRCFRCGGSGVVYTKRGAAARAHLEALRSKLARDLVVGDVILSEGFTAGSFSQAPKWCKVLSVEASAVSLPSVGFDAGRTLVVTCDVLRWELPATTVVRVRQTREAMLATLAQALEFQATLTMQGKPRVRRGAR